MSSVRYSKQAESDLAEILDYSTDKWGRDQADAYLTDLVHCFEQIAERPNLGRSCDPVHPGFHRIEHGRHVIFYRPEPDGVFISRVLHQNMLPIRDRSIDG